MPAARTRSRLALSAALLALLPAALIGAGCGETERDTPVACLGGSAAYERALAAAPGEVLLDGETPIPDCLIRNQSAGDLGKIGLAAVGAATDLNQRARRGDAEAALQAGFLVGALERGSDRTDGIHATLIDRVANAATNQIVRWGPAVAARYERGRAAGSR